jgi:hypothetical protein
MIAKARGVLQFILSRTRGRSVIVHTVAVSNIKSPVLSMISGERNYDETLQCYV